jgi:hypothetical protein
MNAWKMLAACEMSVSSGYAMKKYDDWVLRVIIFSVKMNVFQIKSIFLKKKIKFSNFL